MPVSHPVVSAEEIRAALHTVLASETFTRSQQLSRVLKYLCDSLIAHGPDRISEYAIGTDALGRPADFDPTQDAAVRVEIHRLRRRLRDYYESEGAADPVRIVLPPGSYVPVLSRVGEEQKEPATAPVLASPREPMVTEAAAPTSIPEPEAPPPLPGAHGSLAIAAQPAASGTPARWYFFLAAVAVPFAMLLSGWLLWRPVRPAIASAEMVKTGAPSALPVHMAVRIGCGRRRPWTDRLGQIWAPDQYFEGGDPLEIPAHSYIAGAFDARLYQSARTGSFRYRIPLPAGTYELRLYFIEPLFGPDNDQGGEGNRMLSVSINGQKVLDRFDILSDADGPWTADVRVFKDISPGAEGMVQLDFDSGKENLALVNAIEFLPARPHVLNPVRLLPQDNFYTDSAGNLWTPDNYSKGGRIALHPGPVKNTTDQEIFRHERFGHFRYAIPADHGSYSVYLYMAEEYWGPGNPGGGGEGTRVFSIFANGAALLRGFDLFKEAGTNYGVVRAFHHLKPNAQGKLILSFEPEHDYASLYGLEVLDEAGPDTPSYQRTMSGTGAN